MEQGSHLFVVHIMTLDIQIFNVLIIIILKVTTSIYNLILGKLYCDHYGTMRIEGNREFSCKLKFKEQSIIDRNPHQVVLFFFS
jgi:Oxysterol-binding protein